MFFSGVVSLRTRVVVDDSDVEVSREVLQIFADDRVRFNAMARKRNRTPIDRLDK